MSGPAIRAVCLGEAMVELRSAGPDLFARAVAGDTYNTAVYMRRSLGSAGDVAYLTGVGDDSLGRSMIEDFAAQGLDTSLAFIVPGALPGLYLIELDAQGDRDFRYWRHDSAATRWLAELEARGGAEALEGADLVYLSGISLAILSPDDRVSALKLLQNLRGKVGRIAFDPNVRPRLWPDMATARATVEAVCGLVDVILPSGVDGALLWGETDPTRQLDRYQALGAAEIALTLGADGARLRNPQGDAVLPAPEVSVIDTSGAGDSFNGAYLAARLRGLAPKAAARAGLALAARVVGAPGALVPTIISHPLQELESL